MVVNLGPGLSELIPDMIDNRNKPIIYDNFGILKDLSYN